MAVVYLSLADRLSNGAVAVLGGVVGYALGGLERSATRTDCEESSG
jgi:hypothetical protein